MSPRTELTQDDLAFLDWLSESVEKEEGPVPIPVEVRLNEMSRNPPEVGVDWKPQAVVVALIIVLLAGLSGRVALWDASSLVALLLLGGVFGVGLFQNEAPENGDVTEA